MDLNYKVRLVFSVSSFLDPIDRSTIRGCSSHGTDTIFNTSKTYSSPSVVTRGYILIGIGL